MLSVSLSVMKVIRRFSEYQHPSLRGWGAFVSLSRLILMCHISARCRLERCTGFATLRVCAVFFFCTVKPNSANREIRSVCVEVLRRTRRGQTGGLYRGIGDSTVRARCGWGGRGRKGQDTPPSCRESVLPETTTKHCFTIWWCFFCIQVVNEYVHIKGFFGGLWRLSYSEILFSPKNLLKEIIIL